MKKLILLSCVILSGCTHPLLNPSEYKVVDTLNTRYDNFGSIDGYDVIIKYDSTYHYSKINRFGSLTDYTIRKINTKKYK